MARMTFTVSQELLIQVEHCREKSDEIQKKAIQAGAGIIADEIRRTLTSELKGKGTGDLVDSLGITPVSRDKKGSWNAKVGFSGYDRKGVPNALKARVFESGSSKQKKRPFIRKAVNRKKQEAIDTMNQVMREELEKL